MLAKSFRLRKSLSRTVLSSMATSTHNGVVRKDRDNLIPFSSRLKEGRALALDVWSIFRCVHILSSRMSPHTINSSTVNLPPDCINLGQGYTNFAPPRWVTEAAEGALQAATSNHYSQPKGRIRLREAIKTFYGPKLNRDLDVESEILVTSGANEGS